MIVTPDGDEFVMVAQEAHAHLTGDLAAFTPGGPHQAAYVAAARQHDNGWREADRDATVDADGRPHTFTTVDDDTYEAVWRRGIARAAEVDTLVGLLVGLHGARFFSGRSSAGMRALDAEERARQDRVLGELDLGGTWRDLPSEIAEPSDRIAMLDALSLMLCGAIGDRLSAEVAGVGYTLSRRGWTVAVRPWPFTDDLPSLTVSARRIPAAPYGSHAALREALAATPAFEMPVALESP